MEWIHICVSTKKIIFRKKAHNDFSSEMPEEPENRCMYVYVGIYMSGYVCIQRNVNGIVHMVGSGQVQ